MSLYNSNCFIQEKDESRIFQAAMCIAAKSNLDKIVPNDLNLDDLYRRYVELLDSSYAMDRGTYYIGTEFSEKIEKGLKPYHFWAIHEWAMNLIFKYEICHFNALILRDEFSSIMNAQCPIVMRYKLNAHDKESPIRIIAVLGFDGRTVQFCNPMMDDKSDDNRSMGFEEFWEHTDAGGDLHFGMVFSSSDKFFSPDYSLPDEQYHPKFTVPEITPRIESHYANTLKKYAYIKSEAEVLMDAGADKDMVSTTVLNMKDEAIIATMMSEYNKAANDFIHACIYPDHPIYNKE